MHLHRRKLAAVAAALLCTACGAPSRGPAPQAPAQPAAASQEPGSPAPPKLEPADAHRRLERIANAVEKIWWNQPTVGEALRLSAAQRQRMDALLRSYLEARDAADTLQQTAHLAFIAALEAGDRTAATHAVDQLTESTKTVANGYARLMINVVFELEPDQLQGLRASYPNLLRRPWIRHLQLGNAGRGEGRPRPGPLEGRRGAAPASPPDPG